MLRATYQPRTFPANSLHNSFCPLPPLVHLCICIIRSCTRQPVAREQTVFDQCQPCCQMFQIVYMILHICLCPMTTSRIASADTPPPSWLAAPECNTICGFPFVYSVIFLEILHLERLPPFHRPLCQFQDWNGQFSEDGNTQLLQSSCFLLRQIGYHSHRIQNTSQVGQILCWFEDRFHWLDYKPCS